MNLKHFLVILMFCSSVLCSCRVKELGVSNYPVVLTTLAKCPNGWSCQNSSGKKSGQNSYHCEDYLEVTFTSDSTFYAWSKHTNSEGKISIERIEGIWMEEEDRIVLVDVILDNLPKMNYDIFIEPKEVNETRSYMGMEDNYMLVKKWWQRSIRKKCDC